MFLNPSIVKKLMKQAYKSGLIVAMNEERWLYLKGNVWEISVLEDCLPKQTKGDLIALIGELPLPGERIVATPEGNQYETELPLEMSEADFDHKKYIDITRTLLIGDGETICRVLQDGERKYTVNNVFVDIVSPQYVMMDMGEYAPEKPMYSPWAGILWKGNGCKLRAHFRSDNSTGKILENLKQIDLVGSDE